MNKNSDMNIDDAVQYIESLPDFRRATIGLTFTRLEDTRREATPAHEHKTWDGWVHCRYTEEEARQYTEETSSECICWMSKHRNVDINLLISDLIQDLKEFIEK
jgi:hypothetical protein